MSRDISGFEPATPASRRQYSTRLSYVPTHYSFGVVDFWRGLRWCFDPAGTNPGGACQVGGQDTVFLCIVNRNGIISLTGLRISSLFRLYCGLHRLDGLS